MTPPPAAATHEVVPPRLNLIPAISVHRTTVTTDAVTNCEGLHHRRKSLLIFSRDARHGHGHLKQHHSITNRSLQYAPLPSHSQQHRSSANIPLALPAPPATSASPAIVPLPRLCAMDQHFQYTR